ncbi:MAG TPA: membrane dipeptidase, partial [Parvularculaceae bacterium]|nr:membrane dipeptidase [Parvularculaceae bacterium]
LLPADPDCHHNVRAVSEAQALGHDRSTHGGWNLFDNGCGDDLREAAISGLQDALGAASEPSDAYGFPTFHDWPKWDDLTHQKMWVDWIRRAYRGGLRVMVALAVNNKVLGDMTAGPGDYPTDDKSSADLQIREIKSFVRRHSDFMQLAFSAADVQRIVAADKLAVVIGTEIDHIGDFETVESPRQPSEAEVRTEIDRLYRDGVRYIFPIHLTDNAFGGAAAYVNLFDLANALETGHPFNLVCAPGENIRYRYSNDDLSTKLVLLQLVKRGFAVTSITPPDCPAGVGEKNALGLTPLGRFAIKYMMHLGMLIDIDHMSEAAADQALAIAEQYKYPVNSGHNGVRGFSRDASERQLTARQYRIIGSLHGMAGVGSAKLNAQQWFDLYQDVVRDMGGGDVVAGFGTDADGMEFMMPPRRGSRVRYGRRFRISRDGAKSWDYNRVGVAQYGMLWDFLEDVRSLPRGKNMVDNQFMNGAEYFYETWRQAEHRSGAVP